MRFLKYALLALAISGLSVSANAEVFNPPTANKAGNGIAVSSPTGNSTISTTVTPNTQTGTTYPIASTDGGKSIFQSNASAIADSIVAASTAGFTSGFGTQVENIGTAGQGAVTITATTSVFDNGLSILICNLGQECFISSDGTNYHSVLSLPVVANNGGLCNVSGATNYPTPCTAAQILTVVVSGSGGGTTNFLRADGTWAAPASGSGTVNAGTTPDVAYYATSTAAVSDGGAVAVTVGSLNVAVSTVPANGFDLAGANTVGVSINSSNRYTINQTDFKSTAGSGFDINVSAASSTVPVFRPNQGSAGTGIGAQAAGNWSSIIVGVERERFTNEGILSIQATAPTVTGTGSPTIASGSTDEAGEVTSGATAISLVITFNLTHTNAPFCTVTSHGLPYTSYSEANTALTLVLPTLTSVTFTYNCKFHA